ncbi:MAG: hypothetical protein WBA74_10075 [Cyclobacteriaceae bacterium]
MDFPEHKSAQGKQRNEGDISMSKIDKEVLFIISHITGNCLSIDQSNKNLRLSDLDITNISMTAILFELEKVFNIPVRESQKNVQCSDTLETFVRYIEKHVDNKSLVDKPGDLFGKVFINYLNKTLDALSINRELLSQYRFRRKLLRNQMQ